MDNVCGENCKATSISLSDNEKAYLKTKAKEAGFVSKKTGEGNVSAYVRSVVLEGYEAPVSAAVSEVVENVEEEGRVERA